MTAATANVTTKMRIDTEELQRAVGIMSSEIASGLKQNAADAERTLLTASADVSGRLRLDAGEVERVLASASSSASNAMKQDAGEINGSRSRVGFSVKALFHEARKITGVIDMSVRQDNCVNGLGINRRSIPVS